MKSNIFQRVQISRLNKQSKKVDKQESTKHLRQQIVVKQGKSILPIQQQVIKFLKSFAAQMKIQKEFTQDLDHQSQTLARRFQIGLFEKLQKTIGGKRQQIINEHNEMKRKNEIQEQQSQAVFYNQIDRKQDSKTQKLCQNLAIKDLTLLRLKNSYARLKTEEGRLNEMVSEVMNKVYNFEMQLNKQQSDRFQAFYKIIKLVCKLYANKQNESRKAGEQIKQKDSQLKQIENQKKFIEDQLKKLGSMNENYVVKLMKQVKKLKDKMKQALTLDQQQLNSLNAVEGGEESIQAMLKQISMIVKIRENRLDEQFSQIQAKNKILRNQNQELQAKLAKSYQLNSVNLRAVSDLQIALNDRLMQDSLIKSLQERIVKLQGQIDEEKLEKSRLAQREESSIKIIQQLRSTEVMLKDDNVVKAKLKGQVKQLEALVQNLRANEKRLEEIVSQQNGKVQKLMRQVEHYRNYAVQRLQMQMRHGQDEDKFQSRKDLREMQHRFREESLTVKKVDFQQQPKLAADQDIRLPLGQNIELKSQMNKMIDKIQKLNENQKYLKERADSLEEELNLSQALMREKVAALVKCQRELEQTKGELEHKQGAIASQLVKLEGLQKMANEMKQYSSRVVFQNSKMEEALINLQTKRKEGVAQIERLKNQNSQMQEENYLIGKQLEQLQEDKRTLNERVVKAEQSCRQLIKQLQAAVLAGQSAQALNQVQLKQAIEQQCIQKQQLNRLAELNIQKAILIEQLATKIRCYQQFISESARSTQILQQKILAADSQLQVSRSLAIKSRAEIEQLLRQKRQQTAAIEQLSRKVGELEESLYSCQEENRSMSSTISQNVFQIDRLKAEYKAVFEAKQKVRLEIAQKSIAIAALEESVKGKNNLLHVYEDAKTKLQNEVREKSQAIDILSKDLQKQRAFIRQLQDEKQQDYSLPNQPNFSMKNSLEDVTMGRRKAESVTEQEYRVTELSKAREENQRLLSEIQRMAFAERQRLQQEHQAKEEQLKGRLELYQTEVANLGENILKEKQANTTLREAFAEFKNEQSDYKVRLSHFQNLLLVKELEIDQLKERVESHRARESLLLEDAAELGEEVESCHSQLRDCKSRLEESVCQAEGLRLEQVRMKVLFEEQFERIKAEQQSLLSRLHSDLDSKEQERRQAVEGRDQAMKVVQIFEDKLLLRGQFQSKYQRLQTWKIEVSFKNQPAFEDRSSRRRTKRLETKSSKKLQQSHQQPNKSAAEVQSRPELKEQPEKSLVPNEVVQQIEIILKDILPQVDEKHKALLSEELCKLFDQQVKEESSLAQSKDQLESELNSELQELKRKLAMHQEEAVQALEVRKLLSEKEEEIAKLQHKLASLLELLELRQLQKAERDLIINDMDNKMDKLQKYAAQLSRRIELKNQEQMQLASAARQRIGELQKELGRMQNKAADMEQALNIEWSRAELKEQEVESLRQSLQCLRGSQRRKQKWEQTQHQRQLSSLRMQLAERDSRLKDLSKAVSQSESLILTLAKTNPGLNSRQSESY